MSGESMTPSTESDWGRGKMDLVYFSNEFPKEDLQLVFRRLHALSKDTTHHLLARFIVEATRSVKDELRQLSSQQRDLFPPFETLLDWVEFTELREGTLCGAVDGVLLIVAEVAAYITYVEDHPNELNDPANTALTGLGVGLLSSTAIAMSFTPADLPMAGADAARLAFRMGVHVQGVSASLEEQGEKPDTWAYVVYNVDEATTRKELEAAQSKELIPDTDKIFISAVSRTSVTVSGPPTRLKQLFNVGSRFFRNSRSIALPVFGGMCHAPHVYGPEDVNKIVETDAMHNLKNQREIRLPVYCTSTGRPYPVRTCEELLKAIVSELLTQAIRWDEVTAGLTSALQVNSVSDVMLHSFGNSVPLSDLTAAIAVNLPELKLEFNNFIKWTVDNPLQEPKPRTTKQAKLAIVGMSCRMPGGGTSTEKFWETLEQGLDVSRKIPIDRFDIETHFDPTGKDLNKSMTEYGCFIDNPGFFDGPFFNMSPREAQVVDPQMRLALVTAFEALERSGYVGNRTASTKLQRIGTYYGQAADDYREVNQGQEVSTYYIPGGCRAFGPGRINYFFKFAGPSYSIDTACSSGLAAIEVACQALWNGDVDMAVAGGVNILTNPDGFAGLCNGHFLTKGHNACKTWDATADGYCRADAVGSVVIKRLEDAEADNDNILGVVLAAGTNHSAEAVSITHPHAGHQSYLARQVLRQAAVDPLDVSYIELHGTGTQAGDFEEMSGMMNVYAPITQRRSAEQSLHIGSVKSNVGHSESAAGSTALIKVLMMMQKSMIPKHIGIKTEINPRFPKDSAKRNLHIAFENTPWERKGAQKRLAAINNFGAAGGNTMMILEDGPLRDLSALPADPRRTHVVAVSAKTKSALTNNIENLIAYLDKHEDAVHLPSLAYTTTARKYQYTYRVSFAVADIPTLKKSLAAFLPKIPDLKQVAKSGAAPPLAFAFTGQGASHKSMSLELYRDGQSTFRKSIDHLDSLARKLGFPSFIPALDGSFPQDHAHLPVITQLALVSTEIALVQHWAALGVKPDLVIGHSLGEYAALYTAGVLTSTDALYMVGRRAELLQEKCVVGSHAMVAVRASVATIEESGKPFTVSCINGPTDTVISGTQAEIADVTATLEASGIRCFKLDVAFAFHSSQTDPILEEFENVCKGVIFHEPKIPVISPLLGKVIFDGKTFNATYMRRATREAVDFLSAVGHGQEIMTISDDTMWLEMGPHPVCAGFLKAIMSGVVALPSIRRSEDNWTTMAQTMSTLYRAGVKLDWNECHRPFERQVQLLDLPTYAFDEKNYWLPYIGDWCLTKGNTFYTKSIEAAAATNLPPAPKSEICTSTVQQIIECTIDGVAGTVAMQSDLMQPDFLAAAFGHRMNGCGVITSSIHADIAYTLGEYLYRKFFPRSKAAVKLNVANLMVTKGLVANSNTSEPQLIRVTATTSDIHSGVMDLTWHNVSKDGNLEEFATCNLYVGDGNDWLSQWEPMAHLVHSRVEALERLAAEGKANRFNRNMAYTLFANNLVDYADKYRGMQSVIMHEFEGCADVQLTTKESGTWTVPPFFIDSVAHLAGFIMNCTDSMDAVNNYCVTPGWKSMRFAEPLLPGYKYKSYVKMIPTKADPTIFFGDVYIMRRDDLAVVGMVGGIEFRRYPRILLNRFFSPPDKGVPVASAAKPAPAAIKAAPVVHKAAAPKPAPTPAPAAPTPAPAAPVAAPAAPVAAAAVEAPAAADSMTQKAMMLIAKEAALELEDLQDDVGFSDLGIDSLMSLVLSEKFRSELDLKVSSSLFLDYPLIGDFRKWLDEYHS